MQKFIGRKEELETLEDLWQKTDKEGQLVIIYGKRRVGKTELVKEFIRNKYSAYYLATKTSAHDQLTTASQTIFQGLEDNLAKNIKFENWRNFFDVLGDRIAENDRPKVIIIDEFPYLVESDSAMSSLFQYGWDEKLRKTKTMLILMGSSISMMYKHALNYSAPLYGRRTASMLVEPFSYTEAKEFLDGSDFEKSFSLYSLLGGIPAYLDQLEPKQTLEYNLTNILLKKNSFLRTEPELLISEEFQEPRNYLTVLKAIGLKQTKYSEILNSTGLDTNQLPFYLKTLLELRLIKKEVPITEKNPETSKKGSYSIYDNFLRFYFSFVLTNNSLIESENLYLVVKSKIDTLQALYAKAYEDTSKEIVRNAIKAGKLPQFYEFGRWWDKNNEIDLVGLNSDENSILFVEVKWNNQPVDTDVFWKLVERSELVKWGEEGRQKYYTLISKNGFTEQMKKLAQERSVCLIARDVVFGG